MGFMPSMILPSVPALTDWLIVTIFDSTSWFYVALAIFIVIKFLRCFSETAVPTVYIGERAGKMHKVMALCPQLCTM
jgi:type II secretory pathway component PulF